ncbi:hypothetical protein MTO96_036707 [Rhipicephalus appendiculatus]
MVFRFYKIPERILVVADFTSGKPRGGPGFAKAVAGPTFLVSTVHHVNKLHGGGAIVAHSGLGGYGGGYGLGYGGYGGYGIKG